MRVDELSSAAAISSSSVGSQPHEADRSLSVCVRGRKWVGPIDRSTSCSASMHVATEMLRE